jgi:hypothetical protein
MGIGFHQIFSIEEDYFLQAIQIYEEAFPANEKQSLGIIKNRILEKKSKLIVGIINSEVVCMSLLWEFDSLDFVLLDYMAVSKNHRNKNLGTQLFQYLSRIIISINKFMIIEVENHLFGNNSIERKRRINFYIQNGAYVLENVNYILPSLNDTCGTDMLLMISPKYKSNFINSDLVKDLISRLYIELYNRNENDLVLIKMLKQIPKQIILNNNKLL